jgi:hypothetical protein
MDSSRSTTPPPSNHTQQCPGAPPRPRLTDAERQALRFANLERFERESEHNRFRASFTRANRALAAFADQTNDDAVVPNSRR